MWTLPFSSNTISLDQALTLCEQLHLELDDRLWTYSPEDIRNDTPSIVLEAKASVQLDSLGVGTLTAYRPLFDPARPGLVVSSMSPAALEKLGTWRIDPSQVMTWTLHRASVWLEDELPFPDFSLN